MAAKTDYWGEITKSEVRAPVTILREQAALLGTKTRYLVEAHVETVKYGTSFMHKFNLVVPALDGYTYELFKVSHGIEIYPVRVSTLDVELQNEAEFLAWLGNALSSDETKRIIANLLAQ